MPDWMVAIAPLVAIVLLRFVARSVITRRLRDGRLGIGAAMHLFAAVVWLPVAAFALLYWPNPITLAIAALMAIVTTLTMLLFRPFFEDLARTPE